MKLTPKQDKFVYALRDQGVPAEWAILAVERTHKNCLVLDDFSFYLSGAFVWSESPEGHDFWSSVVDAAAEEEQK